MTKKYTVLFPNKVVREIVGKVGSRKENKEIVGKGLQSDVDAAWLT